MIYGLYMESCCSEMPWKLAPMRKILVSLILSCFLWVCCGYISQRGDLYYKSGHGHFIFTLNKLPSTLMSPLSHSGEHLLPSVANPTVVSF